VEVNVGNKKDRAGSSADCSVSSDFGFHSDLRDCSDTLFHRRMEAKGSARKNFTSSNGSDGATDAMGRTSVEA
jgi:hypothetical protein